MLNKIVINFSSSIHNRGGAYKVLSGSNFNNVHGEKLHLIVNTKNKKLKSAIPQADIQNIANSSKSLSEITL